MRKAWERKKNWLCSFLIVSQYGMWDTKPIDGFNPPQRCRLKLSNYGPRWEVTEVAYSNPINPKLPGSKGAMYWRSLQSESGFGSTIIKSFYHSPLATHVNFWKPNKIMDSCRTFPNFVAAFNPETSPGLEPSGTYFGSVSWITNWVLFEDFGTVLRAPGP